jgi:hypothetical protein
MNHPVVSADGVPSRYLPRGTEGNQKTQSRHLVLYDNPLVCQNLNFKSLIILTYDEVYNSESSAYKTEHRISVTPDCHTQNAKTEYGNQSVYHHRNEDECGANN